MTTQICRSDTCHCGADGIRWDMTTKQCFKCGGTFPLSAFYRHKHMSDGHLNKCIVCVKQYEMDRRERLMQDPEWRRTERARCREKAKRLGPGNRDPQKVAAVRRRSIERAKVSGKYRARIVLGNAVRDGRIKKPSRCSRCGEEKPGRQIHGHHADYSKPLRVRWLCSSCHGKEHRIEKDRLEYSPKWTKDGRISACHSRTTAR